MLMPHWDLSWARLSFQLEMMLLAINAQQKFQEMLFQNTCHLVFFMETQNTLSENTDLCQK